MNNRHFEKLTKRIDTIGRKLVAIAVLLAFYAGGVSAGTEIWSGGDRNDGNWTSNGNWSGIGGAGKNDDLVFPVTAARLSNLNDFPINTSFNSLTFRGNNYNISGNQIFLENGITVDVIGVPTAQIQFNPNIILGDTQSWKSVTGTINLNGVVNLNGNTVFLDTFSTGGIVLRGLINGSGSFLKLGSGTLTIEGDADGFGNTSINQGKVHVTGSLGDVTLGGGTISGTGTLRAIRSLCPTCGGKISPGTSSTNTPGRLSVNGFVGLNSATDVSIRLNGTTAGTQHDQLRVTGSNVDLNNANLELALGFTPTVGEQFTIITQSGFGNITGQFAQGSAIVINSQLFTITYSANSVVLTAQGPINP